MLQLTPLTKSISSLEKALAQPFDEFIRDATIQRFEYSYELCWKMLRRQLAEDQGDSNIKLLSRKELFRVAAEYGYIDTPLNWFSYHKARNETSHIYDEKKADEVFQITKAFLIDAKKLQQILSAKNNA
jgi:nucleotidyltransferase substrate binding protein (TIGR01987 family)